MTPRRGRRPLGALLVTLALAPSAPAQPVVTPEEEARLRALEAEREGIAALALDELLAVDPPTFHGPPGRLQRPTIEVVGDLLLLDWALALTRHGGVENLDRLRAAAQAARRRQLRDVSRHRAVLEEEVAPSSAEAFEAGRTAVPLQQVLADPVDKPTDAAPLPPGPGGTPGSGAATGGLSGPGDRPAGARPRPLDYIPVSPEELRALRDRHRRARGITGGVAWIDELAADPLAEAEWKARAEAERLTNLRRTTPMAIDRTGGYALGEWILTTFKEGDPVGLTIIALVLLGLAGLVYVVVALLRRDA